MTRIFLPASILSSSAINSTISALACSVERPATRSSSTRVAANRASRSAWTASSLRDCSAISRSFFTYSAVRSSTCSVLRSSWSSFWRRRFSSWLSSFFRSRVSFSKSIFTCSRWSLAWRAASFRMFAASFRELWRISAAFSASACASARAFSSVLLFPACRNATYTPSPRASTARTAMSTVDIFKVCLLGRSSMVQWIRRVRDPDHTIFRHQRVDGDIPRVDRHFGNQLARAGEPDPKHALRQASEEPVVIPEPAPETVPPPVEGETRDHDDVPPRQQRLDARRDRRLEDAVRPRFPPVPFPVGVEGERPLPGDTGIVEPRSHRKIRTPDPLGRNLARQCAVQGHGPARLRRKLPEEAVLRAVIGRRRTRRLRALPKADTAFPAEDLLALNDEHRTPFDGGLQGGEKPRGCCARAAETFRPVTPGTLIRTEIAAASNRDKNVAATTVMATLIYTNGRYRTDSAWSAPANAVSPVELNLAFTRWVPGWAASGFPGVGEAHHRPEGIPFFACWLKLFQRSRARQGPRRISCRPTSTHCRALRGGPGSSGPGGFSGPPFPSAAPRTAPSLPGTAHRTSGPRRQAPSPRA